jgi:AraC family transcriptional activator of pobA
VTVVEYGGTIDAQNRRLDDFFWSTRTGFSCISPPATIRMNRPSIPFTLGARDVLAQVIVPTLHRQHWSLDGAQSGAMYRVVHLSSGRGELSHADGALQLRAPDVAWLPAGAARSLRVEAGSAGVAVGVSDSLLAASIGDQADSAALRQISARMCQFSTHDPPSRDELLRSLLAIEAEARHGIGGSWHYLAAHVTIVLVVLWRIAGREAAAPASAGHGDPRLQRFRHLVEAQFRAHWTIARYAAELAMSADRLHDLCVRTLARTPIALVHQRLAREACLLLSGSDLSIERLAADLGFASASHFSRFFKRWMGVGPKAWREQSRAQAAAGKPGLPTSYADWP